jgi:endonuclease/exonuclease/phosphatase family metal-dependent hydrolase
MATMRRWLGVAFALVLGCGDAGSIGRDPPDLGATSTGGELPRADATEATTADACADDTDGEARESSDGDAPPAVDDGADTDDDGAPDPVTPTLRVMSFNIRHGAESSLEEVAAAIRAEAPDIVALQEVDKEAERSDLVFQSYRLGQLTGMASLFRNALVFPEGGEYGLAILSRFPLPSSEKVDLTSDGEQRVLVIVDVEIDAEHVVPIAITHMGLTAAEREQQATEIVAALDDRPLAILMGDFNAEPDAVAFGTLVAAFADAWALSGRGDGFTFPATTPDRRIDYVMLDEAWSAPIEIHVGDTVTSDHRPVIATLPWPGA